MAMLNNRRVTRGVLFSSGLDGLGVAKASDFSAIYPWFLSVSTVMVWDCGVVLPKTNSGSIEFYFF